MNTIEELKEKIVDNYDPDELVELLDIGIVELVECLHDVIEDNRHRFEEPDEDEQE